jgi:hypothetical protein
MQTHGNPIPHASLPGPRGHAMARKGSSQHVKDARSVNGYLPIERFNPGNFQNDSKFHLAMGLSGICEQQH